MATQQEIEIKKQELHAKGIACFKINIEGKELTEDESIARSLDESWSFFYVCVKDPHYNRGYNSNSGNMRFRIFQTKKENPTIPMGYSYMPAFNFECHDGQPSKKAIELISGKVKNKYSYKVEKDEITMIRIKSSEEKKQTTSQKQIEEDRFKIKETDSSEVKAIKERIEKLTAWQTKMKEANKAIRKNDDAKLKELGFTEEHIQKLKIPDFLNRIGFPDYEFTSISCKIRRLKSKIK